MRPDCITYKRLLMVALIVTMLLSGMVPSQAGQSSQSTISFVVTPSPLAVTVSAPASVKEGKTITIQSTIQNAGTRSLVNGTATLTVTPQGSVSLTSGSMTQNLGIINPGQAGTKTVSWQLKALSGGNVTATVVASATDTPTKSIPQMGAQSIITVQQKSFSQAVVDFILQPSGMLPLLF